MLILTFQIKTLFALGLKGLLSGASGHCGADGVKKNTLNTLTVQPSYIYLKAVRAASIIFVYLRHSLLLFEEEVTILF